MIVFNGSDSVFLTIRIGIKTAHALPYIILIQIEFRPRLMIRVTDKTAKKMFFQEAGLRYKK